MQKNAYLYFLTILLSGLAFKTSAQESKAKTPMIPELKINTVFLPAGMLNAAVELPIAQKWSLQGEVFVSPWKSFLGRHLQVYMQTLEARYYFNENHDKWFIGGYFSISLFDLQKWNYWNDKHVFDEDMQPVYNEDGTPRITTLYQRGFNFIAGLDGGYKLRLNEHWTLEAFLGIGTSQGFYHGYFEDDHTRYEHAENWNRSGEIIPTRGGLMLVYKW